MASKRSDPKDPYAPPPMYHDRSGRVVRIGLIAVLLAALGVGYFAWSAGNPQQTAAVTPPVQQQQVADAGYRAQPEEMPQAQPLAPTPPTTSPTPTRRSTPARSSRANSAPDAASPPSASDVAATPAPIPPATTTPQMPDTTPPAQG